MKCPNVHTMKGINTKCAIIEIMKKLDSIFIGLLTVAVVLFIGILCYCIIFSIDNDTPTTFKYGGHDYIKFSNGVVHSPDCERCYGTFD